MVSDGESRMGWGREFQSRGAVLEKAFTCMIVMRILWGPYTKQGHMLATNDFPISNPFFFISMLKIHSAYRGGSSTSLGCVFNEW